MEIDEIRKNLQEAISNFTESSKVYDEIEKINDNNKAILTLELLDGTKVSGRVKNIEHRSSFNSKKMTITIFMFDNNNQLIPYDLSKIKKLY